MLKKTTIFSILTISSCISAPLSASLMDLNENRLGRQPMTTQQQSITSTAAVRTSYQDSDNDRITNVQWFGTGVAQKDERQQDLANLSYNLAFGNQPAGQNILNQLDQYTIITQQQPTAPTSTVGFSFTTIGLPQNPSSAIYSHLNIQSFLTYLKNSAGKSYPKIASAVHIQIGLDPRIPRSQPKPGNDISGYYDAFGINKTLISSTQHTPLRTKVKKETWPDQSVIIKFVKNQNHLSANIARRELLWEKLLYIYKKEFENFKLINPPQQTPLSYIPKINRQTRNNNQSLTDQMQTSHMINNMEPIYDMTIDPHTGATGWVSRQEQEDEERRDELRAMGFDPDNVL